LKPWNVIDYIENHHGDVFVNFLSDVNLGMLNGRFQDNLYVGKNKFGLINFEKISPNPRVSRG
jgi:hypothetical protein